MMTASIDPEYQRLRQAVLLGLFIGTGVGLGYLLAGVPGVELMTLNAALAGAALGLAPGILVGVLSILVYSLASPFGPPVPLLLVGQGLGMGLAGLLGAVAAPAFRRLPALAAMGLAAGVGLVAAVSLDLLTNLAVAAALGLPLIPVLLSGAPVAALHAGTTAAGFALLLPLLVRRLRHLQGRGPRAVAALVGLLLPLLLVPDATAGSPPPEPESPLAAVAAGDTLAVAPADSVATAPGDSLRPPRGAGQRPPRHVMNWRRPLWQPFAASLREDLQRHSHWLPVIDGGQGAAVHYFGEPGTAIGPRWQRDGLPLDLGHRFLDDPEALVIAGRNVLSSGFGLAADGGLGGAIELVQRDATPDRDHLDTRWFKGPHETYLRDIHWLTAAATWRLGFAFGEQLDNEGYDFRTPGETRYALLDDPFSTAFIGHAKLRSGRGLVQRDLGEAGTVTLSLENVRKLKSALPAYGLEHQDLWTTRAALDWRGPAGGAPGRLAVWMLDSDVDWNRRRSSYRKLEGSTTGLVASWGQARQAVQLDASYQRWTLLDSGADPAWAGPDTAAVRMRGEQAGLRAERVWSLGPGDLTVTGGSWWNEHGGWLLGGSAVLADARAQPRWSAALERGGRAPRSDELATAWRFAVPGGGQTVVLPARDLRREDEWRLALQAGTPLAGFDLALGLAVRRLRDGIAWRPVTAGANTGRWDNGLALDSATVRAQIAREGRFLGWLRVRAHAAWRTWDEQGDLHVPLPPPLNWQLAALWENHFFEEDGILQLAWYLRHRGELDDPWFLSTAYGLPSWTVLDMVVGFRLLGADLGLELLNLAGGGSRLSAGTVSPGLEMRWRLHWVFHY
jgi:hypothetical protein